MPALRSFASTGNIIPAGRQSREASNSISRATSRRVEPCVAARPAFSSARSSMRTTSAQTAACGRSNFIANASCCAVPSRACGWRSTFASAISSALHCAASTMSQMLVLVHRDPSLTIPLGVSSDADEIAIAWQTWSDILHLPRVTEDEPREPAPRRRRHNAIRARRPRFLVRRRPGGALDAANMHPRRARDHRAELISRASFLLWVVPACAGTTRRLLFD